MSLSAIGVGSRRNPDGTLSVKVQIIDDASQKGQGFVEFTGASLEDCTRQMQAELNAREAAQADVTVNAAVRGKVLATSQAGKDGGVDAIGADAIGSDQT